MKQLITLFTLALMVAGCTKKLNYKEQYKEDVVSKANIDTSSEYLYVPSMASASRSSKVSRPFWMGQEKRVKFQFTDKALQVLEIETDSRFSSNTSNSKLVLEIPVTHLQFQCAKDKYGECKNEEEENKEIAWNQKSQFKPDFSGVKLSEVSLLAMQMDSLLGQSCYTEVGSRPLNFEITATTVNFKIERSYKADAKCFGYVMANEVASIDKVLNQTQKPFTAIVGGAKVSDKILIIEQLMSKANNILIGGGMAFTFVKAMGGTIGKSLCEDDKLDLAKELLVKAT